MSQSTYASVTKYERQLIPSSVLKTTDNSIDSFTETDLVSFNGFDNIFSNRTRRNETLEEAISNLKHCRHNLTEYLNKNKPILWNRYGPFVHTKPVARAKQEIDEAEKKLWNVNSMIHELEKRQLVYSNPKKSLRLPRENKQPSIQSSTNTIVAQETTASSVRSPLMYFVCGVLTGLAVALVVTLNALANQWIDHEHPYQIQPDTTDLNMMEPVDNAWDKDASELLLTVVVLGVMIVFLGDTCALLLDIYLDIMISIVKRFVLQST